MIYKEFLDRLFKTIDDPVFLKDYKAEGLNWTHPIRVAVAMYEYEKYLAGNAPATPGTSVENPAVQVNIAQRSILSVLKSQMGRRVAFLPGMFKKGKLFLGHILTLTGLYVNLIYLSVFKRIKTLNFSLDNYDVKYGDYYFNPYSDNIHTQEKAIGFCFAMWKKQMQLEKAFYPPIVINAARDAYFGLFGIQTINIDFLQPLQHKLSNEAFRHVKNNIQQTFNNYRFFKFVLAITNPERIYLYDSYNVYSFGLIAAGKKAGSTVIEQQHGAISPANFGYIYNYTSNSQADFICTQLNYYTRPLIDWTKKGWKLPPALHEIEYSPAIQVWKKFNDRKDEGRLGSLKAQANGLKIITLGLTDLLLPEWLIDAIISVKEGYFFCFRFHPRYKSYNQVQIEDLMAKLPYSDSGISSTVPLFDLLEVTDFFVSDGSTTLIDSLSFSLTAVCFSEYFAQEIFQPYIDEKSILLATNADGFRAILSTKATGD